MEVLKKILKAIEWKKHLNILYYKSVSPVIDEMVAGTDPTWDDSLKAAFDLIVVKFIGTPE